MKREKLSQIIWNYRYTHGLSQEKFAEQCGLSKAYISVLEREMDPNTGERTKPKMETYEKLAKGMGMTRDSLISRVEGKEMFTKYYFVKADAHKIPIISIDTNQTIEEMMKNSSEVMTVSDDMYKPEKTIAIKVSDENLAPEIASGDIIIVWLDEKYSDGDFVCVRLIDSKLSCYKVSQQNSNNIILYGNQHMRPVVLDLKISDIRKNIIGKVVCLYRNF